jgi:hypothetical protein
VNHDIARALDRLALYLGRVKTHLEARDIYQAMSDTAELAEIARRLYVTLGSAAREPREAATNTERFKTNTR